MLRKRKILFLTLLSLTSYLPAMALEPCSPDTWYANPNRSSAEWQELARWVAVGELIESVERIEPYPNCSLADRSQCTMMDTSSVTFHIERTLKGEILEKSLTLSKDICAPTPPKEIGARYRIYGGSSRGFYIFIEKVD